MPTAFLRAALLAAALLPAAGAAATSLTLEQALERAVQRSQATRAAEAGASGAAERAAAAGQLPDPMLTLALDNLPATGATRLATGAEDMTMKRIGLAQEWVPAAKRDAQQALAGAALQRESAAVAVAAADTRLQTALAFVDAHFAGRLLALAAQAERYAAEALATGRARLASPAGSSAEVLALAGALGGAEDASAEGRQQQAAADAMLARWTGPLAGEALAAPQLGAPPSQADFVQAHPAVLMRQRELALARREAEAARLERRPNWRYELSYGQRVGRPDMVSFGVSLPLPVAPAARQDRETAARLQAVAQAEAALAEAERAAAGEHAARAAEAEALQQRSERFASAVLAPLQQRTAATLAAYRANQASLSMVFEAREAELDAQRRLLALQREQARAQAQLIFTPVSTGALR